MVMDLSFVEVMNIGAKSVQGKVAMATTSFMIGTVVGKCGHSWRTGY